MRLIRILGKTRNFNFHVKERRVEILSIVKCVPVPENRNRNIIPWNRRTPPSTSKSHNSFSLAML